VGKLEEAANQKLQTEFEEHRLKSMKGLIVDRDMAEKALSNIKQRIIEVEDADTRDKWDNLPQYKGDRY